MYGICGDVYDRLDCETHAKDKTMRYLSIWENNILNTMKEMICMLNGQYDGHFKRTIVDLSVSLRKLLYDSFFPSLCIHYRV